MLAVRMRPSWLVTPAVCLGLLGAWPALAASSTISAGQIPDEYESTSGHGIAMNNAGYALNDGASAIRANPALLATQKQYTVTAGYHWPGSGRDYYQAAIVDSQTSSFAAGVSYTGFLENYAYHQDHEDASVYDSPLVRRGVLGLAQRFGALSLGAGATYIESNPLWSARAKLNATDQKIKGVGLNLGGAYSLSPELSLGAAVENASNRRIDDYAPRTIRAGVAYAFARTLITYLDFRQRDRVGEFESARTVDLDVPAGQEDAKLAPEQMVIASFTAQVQDVLRVIGSYAQGLTDKRRSLAGGVAVVNKNFSLSYTVARPYMNQSTAHQAVTLSMDMAM